MKTKHLLLSVSIMLLAVFGFLVLDIQKDDHYNLAKREILMRKVGHEILLHSGDSTSRVLPVSKLKEETYRLQFENPFTFEPDTLVQIIRRTLSTNNESPDYLVNVIDCSTNQVVYGYAIAKQKKNDVLACLGRKQVSACYLVTVEFGSAPFGVKKYVAAASLLAVFALCPFVIIGYRGKKSLPKKLPNPKNNLIPIGTILFDNDKKQLVTQGETIKLTAKETRLLWIFAQNPNEIIDRSRLQKEIWEDEGIIVGRSLDVFISKLRKKLESDTKVQLVNIHGKGYRLQIETGEI
jgi:DNA-binding winged helix-turn-helix (wHTH) protein